MVVTRLARTATTAVASLALAAGSVAGAIVTGVGLSPASAAPACTPAVTSSTALPVTVTCTYSGGGLTNLTVPTGTSSIDVVAIGAGGSGARGLPLSYGGDGAKVTASLDATGLSSVTAVVGAGGGAGTSGSGGVGGGFTALYSGSSTAAGDVLVVAGGGGGAGFYTHGGDGAAANTAAGGNGEDAVANGAAEGGRGAPGTGAGGAGGAAPTINHIAGTAGSSWAAGGAGGDGAVLGGAWLAGGGAGYGGGGGGAALSDPPFSDGYGAGGAGGSFVVSTATSAAYAPLNATAGSGQAGAGGDSGPSSYVGGDGTITLTFNAPTNAPPAAPTNVTLTPGDQSLAVSATIPTANPSVTDVEYSTDGGTSWASTAQTSGTFTISHLSSSPTTPLTNGTTYSVQVRAMSTGTGGGTGTASSAASGTPATTPGAPTGLSGTPGNAQVALSWTAPSDNGGSAVSGYKVEYGTTSSGTGTVAVADTGSTATTYTVTGLTNGTAYWFKVSAINGQGTGTGVVTSSSVTPATAPGAPTNVAGTTGALGGKIDLTWTAPNDGGSAITGYKIETSPDGTTGWTVAVATTGSATASTTLTGLTVSTDYHVRVSAINAVSTGPASLAAGPVTSSGPVPTPPAPSPSGSGSSSTPTPKPSPTPTPSPSIPATLDPIPLGSNTNLPAAGLKPAASVLLVGGAPVTVTVTPNTPTVAKATALQVDGPGFGMRLESQGLGGGSLTLAASQALVLQSEPVTARAGTRARIGAPAKPASQPVLRSSGHGFVPNSMVRVFLLPNTVLGTIPTDASGAYDGTVVIPAGIVGGEYTLQVNSFTAEGQVRSLFLGVLVKPAKAPAVTSTAKASVQFAAVSSTLTPTAKATLTSLVKRTGKSGVRTVVVGYVQRTSVAGNDAPLATARAKTVAAYLRALGLNGAFRVEGSGRGTGAESRRATVAVTYRK